MSIHRNILRPSLFTRGDGRMSILTNRVRFVAVALVLYFFSLCNDIWPALYCSLCPSTASCSSRLEIAQKSDLNLTRLLWTKRFGNTVQFGYWRAWMKSSKRYKEAAIPQVWLVIFVVAVQLPNFVLMFQVLMVGGQWEFLLRCVAWWAWNPQLAEPHIKIAQKMQNLLWALGWLRPL